MVDGTISAGMPRSCRELDVERGIVTHHVAAEHEQFGFDRVQKVADLRRQRRKRKRLRHEMRTHARQQECKLSERARREPSVPSAQRRRGGAVRGRLEPGASEAFPDRIEQARHPFARARLGKLVCCPVCERAIEDRLRAGAFAQQLAERRELREKGRRMHGYQHARAALKAGRRLS